MEKHTRKPSWSERIRKLLGPNESSGLYRLEQAFQVHQGVLFDWLMGKKKPGRTLARKIARLEEADRRMKDAPGLGRPLGSYRPWHARFADGRKRRAPALPKEGPLGYERYLDLAAECARACFTRADFPSDEQSLWSHSHPSFMRSHEDATHADRKRLFRRACDRLEEASRRFADEVRAFPLPAVAARDGLGPEEIRILAYLLKEDVALYEGRGTASGRLLVQIASGPGGDRLAARTLLAPEGKLRKSGLLERQNRDGGLFGWLKAGPSVLDGTYALTPRAREELLRPLLSRSVSEAKPDGLSRVATPRFGLESVVLSAAHRQRIAEFRAEFRHRKLLYETWGLSGVVHYGRGLILLFEGPPGTGKTMLAEALAREERLPFMTARFPKLVSCWVGETEKNIERLFREAREEGALLFIDEADGIFGSRDLAHRSWEIRDVNVLLKEVEEFEGVCVLATNNVAILDRALESRLSLRLEFGMPDEALRLEIWRKHLPAPMPLAPDVDLPRLARRFEISGRDIKQAVLAAARTAAARDGADAVVGMGDLEPAAAERLAKNRKIGFADPPESR